MSGPNGGRPTKGMKYNDAFALADSYEGLTQAERGLLTRMCLKSRADGTVQANRKILMDWARVSKPQFQMIIKKLITVGAITSARNGRIVTYAVVQPPAIRESRLGDNSSTHESSRPEGGDDGSYGQDSSGANRSYGQDSDGSYGQDSSGANRSYGQDSAYTGRKTYRRKTSGGKTSGSKSPPPAAAKDQAGKDQGARCGCKEMFADEADGIGRPEFNKGHVGRRIKEQHAKGYNCDDIQHMIERFFVHEALAIRTKHEVDLAQMFNNALPQLRRWVQKNSWGEDYDRRSRAYSNGHEKTTEADEHFRREREKYQRIWESYGLATKTKAEANGQGGA